MTTHNNLLSKKIIKLEKIISQNSVKIDLYDKQFTFFQNLIDFPNENFLYIFNSIIKYPLPQILKESLNTINKFEALLLQFIKIINNYTIKISFRTEPENVRSDGVGSKIANMNCGPIFELVKKDLNQNISEKSKLVQEKLETLIIFLNAETWSLDTVNIKNELIPRLEKCQNILTILDSKLILG